MEIGEALIGNQFCHLLPPNPQTMSPATFYSQLHKHYTTEWPAPNLVFVQSCLSLVAKIILSVYTGRNLVLLKAILLAG